MSSVIVDAAMAERLEQLHSQVEVRTSDGRLIGFFTPPVREGTAEEYEWARQQFTEEKIEAARKQTGGYTTAEVLAHLRSLDERS